MDKDFWINITKNKSSYLVEKWQVDKDRILYVEKKKTLTYFGAKRYAKKYIINKMVNQYIKEK